MCKQGSALTRADGWHPLIQVCARGCSRRACARESKRPISQHNRGVFATVDHRIGKARLHFLVSPTPHRNLRLRRAALQAILDELMSSDAPSNARYARSLSFQGLSNIPWPVGSVKIFTPFDSAK